MALRFNEQPYNFNEGGNILAQFRGRGWAVLRNVFDRDSVDAFRELLLSRCDPPATAEGVGARYVLPDDAPETVAPLYAPRLRQILPQTLSAPRTIGQPRASLVEASWIIEHEGSAESAPESPRRAWHKDQQHEGIGSGGYEYPLDVHLAIYLQDVESLECGPTEIIAGSHWAEHGDRHNPHNPLAEPPSELMTCRKEDVILWDQRCYHRGNARFRPGPRIVGICGFYPVVLYDQASNFAMPRAVAAAWAGARDAEDEAFWGGQWSASSVVAGLRHAGKL